MILKPETASKIKIKAVKLFVVLGYLLYSLVSKLYGILVLSLILYFSAPSIGLGQPYTAHELLIWLNELPENYKTTVSSSLLTIVGFLIAFSIGSAQQRKQFISQMKIEVASDIEAFFNEVSRVTTDIEIYAKYCLKVSSEINENTDQNSIDFHMYNILGETNKFLQKREILRAKSIEVHRFIGRYSIILASTWGALEQLEKATEAFNNIAATMWFPAPLINVTTENKQEIFIQQIDEEKLNQYIEAYKNNYGIMNSTTGGLRGRLIAPITGMNFSAIVSLLRLK
ncbi:hypothetical protein [Sulfuriflexus mobilis]|uniref:hypothetical protein n=1 Tax=Sulfuriflexus mobilis TaxID=1811807 RepID=UPI000F84896D|nr:hypothetical protein [Sulfuriflexus mobilis]